MCVCAALHTYICTVRLLLTRAKRPRGKLPLFSLLRIFSPFSLPVYIYSIVVAAAAAAAATLDRQASARVTGICTHARIAYLGRVQYILCYIDLYTLDGQRFGAARHTQELEFDRAEERDCTLVDVILTPRELSSSLLGYPLKFRWKIRALEIPAAPEHSYVQDFYIYMFDSFYLSLLYSFVRSWYILFPPLDENGGSGGDSSGRTYIVV